MLIFGLAKNQSLMMLGTQCFHQALHLDRPKPIQGLHKTSQHCCRKPTYHVLGLSLPCTSLPPCCKATLQPVRLQHFCTDRGSGPKTHRICRHLAPRGEHLSHAQVLQMTDAPLLFLPRSLDYISGCPPAVQGQGKAPCAPALKCTVQTPPG